MSRKATLVALTVLAGMMSGTTPAQQESSHGDTPRTVTIAQLRATPTAFKNVLVSFTGQFMGIGSVHNPFFTRFTRSDYVNFAIWGSDQKLWERMEYDNPLSTLFVSKKIRKHMLDQVYNMPRYQQIECIGFVRNVFKGAPWIEITEIDETSEQVTTATLAHMRRARELMNGHKWMRAASELNLAQTGGLPSFTRGWIHAYLGISFMRAGKIEEAKEQLQSARAILSENPEVLSLVQALSTDPKSTVDSTVLEQQIPRAKRPMWVAYEESIKYKDPTRRPGKPSTTPAKPSK
ncbi:MAG: tetratricopeptide repeat protein [Planctomycetota bacterium]